MIKKLALIVALTTCAFATETVAAQRKAEHVKLDTYMYTIKDNALFTSPEKAIRAIPGAKAAATGKSSNAEDIGFQAWVIPSGKNGRNNLVKALSSFKIDEAISVSDRLKTGKTTPFSVSEDIEYVKSITAESHAGGTRYTAHKAIVSTGYRFETTPSIHKDGVHLKFRHSSTKLTGPDNGFKNHKVEGGVLQLRHTNTQDYEIADMRLPDCDEALVFLRKGSEKNEFVVTVMTGYAVK